MVINVINKIEDYLNNLDNIDKKILILLYLLCTLLIGLIYYSFNYSILREKIEQYDYQVESLEKKIKSNKSLINKLKKLRKNTKILEYKNSSLGEDIKYLNMLINSSNILNINEKRFFTILRNILQKAVENNIKASYKIEINVNKFKVYSIYINGKFNKKNFFDFFNFIKDLESIKNVKKVHNLSLTKENNFIKFSLIINFWSIL